MPFFFPSPRLAETRESKDIKCADREGRYRENGDTYIEIENSEKRKRKFEEVKSEVENKKRRGYDVCKLHIYWRVP